MWEWERGELKYFHGCHIKIVVELEQRRGSGGRVEEKPINMMWREDNPL